MNMRSMNVHSAIEVDEVEVFEMFGGDLPAKLIVAVNRKAKRSGDRSHNIPVWMGEEEHKSGEQPACVRKGNHR